MPSQTAAQSLAYVSWTLLLALALGAFVTVVLLRRTTDASTGYLSTTALFASILGILTWLADGSLPPPDGLVIVPAPHVVDQLRQAALLVFVAASAVATVSVRRGSGLALSGSVGVLAGVVAFASAAAGWAPDAGLAVPLLLQYLVLSAATGGCLAMVVLGHWYLVTPKLSERPLIVGTRLLTGIIGLQLVLFATWAAFGSGPGAGAHPFSVLTGSSALLIGLRLIVSLIGPLVLGLMAERTARTRSMESATGLLYIDLAAIISGTIVAAALAYGSGLLV